MGTDPLSLSAAAIEARLRERFSAAVWAFHLVPDALTVEEFKSLAERTPLIALSWRQFNPEPHVGRQFIGRLGWRLTIVVKNQGRREARFLGDRLAPGLFEAMTAAIVLIHGFTQDGLGTYAVTAAAQAYAEGYADLNTAIATVDVDVLINIGDFLRDAGAEPDFLRLVSRFDPDGLDGDEPAPLAVRGEQTGEDA